MEMEAELEEARETFKSGKTRGFLWRRSQLRALGRLLGEEEEAICRALKHDIGKHRIEAFRDEVGVLIKSVDFALENLKKWMTPEKVSIPLASFPTTGQLVPEPLGVVLIFSSWNYPIGSARVGRTVMAAAAKNLTPVALELGGKCPAIVDSLSSIRDQKVAIERLAGGKWGPCCGQACIGIDYLLVHEKFAPVVVERLKATIKKFYAKPEYIARIINKKHFERLSNLLRDPLVAASIVHGGSQDIDKLFIEPTILLDPPLDAEIMTEEIFGPFLPIITLKKNEDSIEFIRERPNPLVIYAFTKDEKLKSRIVAETSSGSVTFNDTMIQYVCDTLPFGGVGQSGFGQYHGKFSFDLFSHRKAVLRRGFITEFTF